VVITDHHVRCPKETLLHFPALVPARSAYWLASASVSKSGLSGSSPEKKAEAMAKGGWSEEGVQIKGNFTVSIAFIQNSSACGAGDNCIVCVNDDPPRFYIQAEGVGDTSSLGTLFLKIQKCADPTASQFGSYQGTFVMTAPNGKDSLAGIYTGKNTSGGDVYGFLPFSGDLKITAGTGRFDDARGHARFTGFRSQRHGVLCSRRRSGIWIK
jgi:hypothetical protein